MLSVSNVPRDKMKGKQMEIVVFFIVLSIHNFFFLLEKDSWVEIVRSIFFFTKVEFVKNKKNVETELDR